MPGAGPEDEYMLRPGYPEEDPGQPPAAGGGWSGGTQDQDGEWPAYPDQVYAASSWARGGAPRREKRTALWAFVALLCGAALCLLGFAVSSLYQAYIPFRQRVAQVSGDTFAPGLTVKKVRSAELNTALFRIHPISEPARLQAITLIRLISRMRRTSISSRAAKRKRADMV